MAADPDTIVFASDLITVGQFLCPVGHPRFRDSGPIKQSCFVFPRTSVVIEHEGQRPFVTDPAMATLYNTGQRYERRAVSDDGDRCDWFAVKTEILCDAVREFDEEAAASPPRAMRYTHAPVSSRLYLQQRHVFTALVSGATIDRLEVEERVVSLLSQILQSAYAARSQRTDRRSAAAANRAELANAARAVVSRRYSEPLSLGEVATTVECSPFHLCRAFKASMGSTIHQHLTAVRLRAALERLQDGEDVTNVALQTGFSSHSHFTAAFRRAFDVTPSRVFRARF